MTRHQLRPWAAVVTALACMVLPPAAVGAEDHDLRPGSPGFAIAVLEKVDDQFRGTSSHAVLEMEVETAHWRRHLSLESWSLGTDHSLFRILEPKKERGTATLKARSDLFTYLSKTGRTIKITSGMMGASWMGSHFTNDDLVRETRLSEDFDIDLVTNGVEDGVGIYRFSLVPHPETPVVWGRIEVTVRRSDLQPLHQLFFDEDDAAVRELVFSNHALRGGRTIPTEVVIRPLDGSGEYTRVTWKEIEFEIAIDAGFFSLRRLRSM